MKRYLAIDIGASSGRHIVGWNENGILQTEEIYRFKNGVKEEQEHFVWDIANLLKEVQQGIMLAKEKYSDIYSFAIDTWAVDYVLLRNEKEILPVYAYRDDRTEDCIEQVHQKISFSELYRRTGCQFQPFNSIYQLYADKIAGRLEQATDLLMLPEYLLYKLCGCKVREYTNATTTGMVNVKTGQFDSDIIERLEYPEHLFPEVIQPGMVVGEYLGIKAILCATHDTASAVEGIPMEKNQPYISSGTWSLLGVKTRLPITDEASEKSNYSNEGGIGYNRYQKNIMGMWLVNQLQKELCPELSFEEIVKAAEESKCRELVDANAPYFLAPESMKRAFDRATDGRLKELGDYFSCAYRSLAVSYQEALKQLEQNTGKQYEELYIVGGGAKNRFLNCLTEEAIGRTVYALPVEATVWGNLKIQMEAG